MWRGLRFGVILRTERHKPPAIRQTKWGKPEALADTGLGGHPVQGSSKSGLHQVPQSSRDPQGFTRGPIGRVTRRGAEMSTFWLSAVMSAQQC